MTKSKTLIEKQLKKKNNKLLVDTIILAKRNPAWLEVASRLSGPTSKNKNVNLADLEKLSEGSEIIVVPGKVLSGGEITKKLKIAAVSYSDKAREKLIKAGCEVLSIDELINKNKDAKGVKILK
jgi:large subunit ribosomal protein L18e